MMETEEVQLAADTILDFHRRGQRNVPDTVKNIVALLRKAPEHRNWLVFQYLWDLLALELEKPPLKLTSSRVVDPCVIEVVMRTFIAIGEAPKAFTRLFERLRVFTGLFGHLQPPEGQTLMNNWTQHVLPIVGMFISSEPDKLQPEFLQNVSALCDTYLSDRSRRLIGVDKIDERLLFAMQQLRQTIDEINFSRFESDLRSTASDTNPSEDESRTAGDGFIAEGTPPEVLRALSEAGEYLHSDGEFKPKIAADLLRACIDTAHRAVIAELGREAPPFTENDNDGQRRIYMRKAEFISLPEEKFFSAIYTLLSEEASHKLVAEKETVLVMNLTIGAYIRLLFRRLPVWKSQHSQAANS